MPQIRPALSQDAPGVAHVHVQSWQTSYRGLIADEVLDNQSLPRRQTYWEQVLTTIETEANVPHFVFVAENETGEIVGFTSGGKSREENLPFEGELYAIYLLDEAKHQGLGAKLFQAFVEKLLATGYHSMMLWVLSDNLPARRFYEKMGGRAINEQTITIGGYNLSEVAYGWDTISH
ncbi:MAG TPA: GNAT family N-acetyltransferase [Anaerolineales bacterium]|nr:GNAT family N-acetyltransferase [Anaerolineales bacterium]